MKDLISFSKIARQFVGVKLYYLLFLVIAAALLQGLGISLMLPLLQGVESENEINKAISLVFGYLDLDYTFRSVLLLMTGFFFLRGYFLIYQARLLAKVIARLLVSLRCKESQRIFEADYQYLLKNDIGYLSNTVVREFEGVINGFKNYVNFMAGVVYSSVYIVLPLIVNFTVTGIIFILGIPAFYFLRKINLELRDCSIQQSAHSARLQGFIIQAFGYLKYLKSTHSYGSVLSKIVHESKVLGELKYRKAVLDSIANHAFEPFAVLMLCGVLFYSVEIMGQDILEIVFMLYLIKQCLTSLLSIQVNFRKFISSVGSVNVYTRLSKELTEHAESIQREGMNSDFKSPIRFRDVSFGYDIREPVLKNINLSIPPKGTVAFVGGSGAGKSTLVNLLTGLIKPTTGEILIGDVNYEEINQDSHREEIGYITQETVIFNDSIENNISLWNEEISEEEIKQASERAHIRAFIEALPESYRTLLGDGGINISGGQRQRIMIARELCKKSSLLVFDEATSALDTHSEKEIQRNIDEFKGEKTIVIIAHRLSTVRNSDLIYVLRDGRIVEEGTYDQLYNLRGEFRSMVDQQMVVA
tara:strand:+ start:89 stop:1849 length:1761 start_codon:yes stop_codon:yes gene_type:complete